jgi:hypothetical protein
MTLQGLSFFPYRVSVSDGQDYIVYSLEALNDAHACEQASLSFLGLQASPEEGRELTIRVIPLPQTGSHAREGRPEALHGPMFST